MASSVREGTLADRPTQLVLDALNRAVGEPAGLPLVASRNAPGLFPATAVGRQAAQRCRDDGLLQPSVALNGKTAPECFVLSPTGLAYLIEQTNPRTLLEDLVRAVEARQRQFGELVEAMRQAQVSLEGLRTTSERVLATLPKSLPADRNGHAAPAPARNDQALLTELANHRGPGDYPLPGLYRQAMPDSTIGEFHDALRRLEEHQRIHLHPWTGPLYQMPEPSFALLVGHEVAYYASRRQES
jgi:hypothetical protein